MPDSKYFKLLDCLMREDELLFRFGITYLFSVGYENLTEKAVQNRIEIIEKEALTDDEECIPIISPVYRIAILRMALKIHEVPIWVLLKYISEKVKIS